MAKATQEALSELHGVVATELVRRISNQQEATAADIGAAIKFLKDNHITAAIEDNSTLTDLKKKLDEKMAARSGKKVVPLRPTPSLPTDDEVDDVLDSLQRGAM